VQAAAGISRAPLSHRQLGRSRRCIFDSAAMRTKFQTWLFRRRWQRIEQSVTGPCSRRRSVGHACVLLRGSKRPTNLAVSDFLCGRARFGNRSSETEFGDRKPETGNRKQGTGYGRRVTGGRRHRTPDTYREDVVTSILHGPIMSHLFTARELRPPVSGIRYPVSGVSTAVSRASVSLIADQCGGKNNALGTGKRGVNSQE
jgi:hypothetical protein